MVVRKINYTIGVLMLLLAGYVFMTSSTYPTGDKTLGPAFFPDLAAGGLVFFSICLIAQTAMESGMFARTAETIGMAQRGGSVVSHVRIGHRVGKSREHHATSRWDVERGSRASRVPTKYTACRAEPGGDTVARVAGAPI